MLGFYHSVCRSERSEEPPFRAHSRASAGKVRKAIHEISRMLERVEEFVYSWTVSVPEFFLNRRVLDRVRIQEYSVQRPTEKNAY
jgi:hypothetical protein